MLQNNVVRAVKQSCDRLRRVVQLTSKLAIWFARFMPQPRRERLSITGSPQKMLVWEDDGVLGAYNGPAYLAERHGLTGAGEPLMAVTAALAEAATAPRHKLETKP